MDCENNRKSTKRKLFEVEEDYSSSSPSPKRVDATEQDIENEVLTHIEVLSTSFSASFSDRLAAKYAARSLSKIAKNEDLLGVIVDCGAVPVLVMQLEAPPLLKEDGSDSLPFEHEVERACAYTLGLLAEESEYQQLIVDAGAVRPLVNLLKRHKSGCNFRAASNVSRRAADAIANLAHENSHIKDLFRHEGGIRLLVELLDSADRKVQKAAAGALRCLAFQNDENKNQIIECNGLPSLVLMLRSDDASIHYEAVGTIGNMVHSSPGIKREVLLCGALQPVIQLLSSPCIESQREAALLIGQFAAVDSDYKAYIVQRGALRPLIQMLHSDDTQLKEMAAFSIGRLAQDTHNQAGIAYNGGIAPLLELLSTKNGSLQHNAAFTLLNLADNEDIVADLILVGGFQILQDGEFICQITKDCVARTIKKIQEKICGRVLKQLLYLMRNSREAVKSQVVLALAHLCTPDDQKNIFIDNHGLEMLLRLLQSTSLKQQLNASMALHKLATKAASLSFVGAPPMSPTTQVYLGEKYINNATLSDVTFIVEGKQFYAHRICLLASSDAFRAMFDGGYREKNAEDIKIPNIRWDVFELMMRFIYTGSVDVNAAIAHDLLRAADQYLLESLKRLCEYAIAQDISVENIQLMYNLSETYNAMSLKQACIMFVLRQFESLSAMPWFTDFLEYVMPDLRNYFTETLSNHIQVEMKDLWV